MNFNRDRARTSMDTPLGYLYAEDMIQQMTKIQQMQLLSKKEGLSQYGGADFDTLLKVMSKQVEAEIAAMTQFTQSQGDIND